MGFFVGHPDCFISKGAFEKEAPARHKDVSSFSIGFLTDLNARKSKIALFDFRLKKNAMDGFFRSSLINAIGARWKRIVEETLEKPSPVFFSEGNRILELK